MQKSKDITKYNIHWQIVRVQAKKYKDVTTKLDYVLHFYQQHKTLDNYERIMNWLEGLAMGYRDISIKAKILGSKVLFEKVTTKEPIMHEKEIEHHAYTEAKKYSPTVVKDCFVDNYTRFRKWASEGYIHEELYSFTYGLLKYLTEHNVSTGRNQITLADMAKMHLDGSFAPNKYKFKFK